MVVAAVVELTTAFGLPGTEGVNYGQWCTADHGSNSLSGKLYG